jgi:hypothetical protein
MSQPTPLQVKVAKLVRILRKKRGEITPVFQAAEKNLMRSFDLDPKDRVVRYAERQFILRQEHRLIQDSTHYADSIQARFAEFTGTDTPEDLETYYTTLCSYKTFLAISDLDAIIALRPPKQELAPPVITELNEKDIGPYVKKFAEAKGSTQGMSERLTNLFPTAKGKQPVFTGTSRLSTRSALRSSA